MQVRQALTERRSGTGALIVAPRIATVGWRRSRKGIGAFTL